MFLLLILNRFYIIFWCFYRSFWASKIWLGSKFVFYKYDYETCFTMKKDSFQLILLQVYGGWLSKYVGKYLNHMMRQS